MNYNPFFFIMILCGSAPKVNWIKLSIFSNTYPKIYK